MNTASTEPRGASNQKTSLVSRFKMLLHMHRQEIRNSYLGLIKTPVATLMTVAVLGIAIALPVGLQLFLKNAQTVSADWNGASRFSLYLKQNVSEQKADELLARLLQRLDVQEARLIDRDQGLEEFQNLSGLGDALKQLDENPLPLVIEVVPTENFALPEASQNMLDTFQALPEVDMAKLDMQWVKKLYYLLKAVDRFLVALATMLGLAVLLIVGNTIRLAIQNRRQEIEIIKLIGATNAFIRRPFLYTGLWYGLAGGIFAIVLLTASVFWLSGPVNQLAAQYNSSYLLQGLNFSEALNLLLFSAGLGLVGSWISVTRHLSSINPT